MSAPADRQGGGERVHFFWGGLTWGEKKKVSGTAARNESVKHCQRKNEIPRKDQQKGWGNESPRSRKSAQRVFVPSPREGGGEREKRVARGRL